MMAPDKKLMSKYTFLEVMVCITLDISVILIDGPIKQYYLCILREPVFHMSYDLRIVEP